MKNIKCILLVVFGATIFAACDHYDEIKGSTTRRVVYVRPYELIGREEGGYMLPEVFGTGQWNHKTSGPAIGYDFDIANEQWPITDSVVMANKLTINTKFVWQYKLKDDPQALKELLWNFVKVSDIEGYEIHTSNSLKAYAIISDNIFEDFCAPFINTAAKDVLCRLIPEQINTELVAAQSFEAAKRILASIKYPKLNITQDGLVEFTGKDSISILDCIDLTGVTFNEYSMPGEVQQIIADISDAQSDYQALQKDREVVAVRAKTKVEKAQAMAKKNAIMEQILRENPQVLSFAAFQKLQKMLQSGEVKAKVVLVPAGNTNVHLDGK